MYKKSIFTLLFAVFLIGCQSDDVVEKSPVNEDAVEETVNADEQTENNANNTENEPLKFVVVALTLNYIDAGQGDPTLLQYKDDEEQYTILYDTGDWLGSEVVP